LCISFIEFDFNSCIYGTEHVYESSSSSSSSAAAAAATTTLRHDTISAEWLVYSAQPTTKTELRLCITVLKMLIDKSRLKGNIEQQVSDCA